MNTFEKTDYNFYLFHMLYMKYLESKRILLTYDDWFKRTCDLYDVFTNSPYDDPKRNLYECIEDFIKDHENIIITV